MTKFPLLLAAATLGVAASASAANYYWDAGTVTVDSISAGGTGAWTIGAAGWENGASAQNWADGNLAVFGGTGGTATLGGNISATGLRFTNTAGYTITGATAARTLTIGASGIDMSAAAADVNFGSNMTIAVGANSQTWNVATGRTLSLSATNALNGTLTGTSAATITVDGGGLVDLLPTGTGASGYAGNWLVQGGSTLRSIRTNAAAFGTGVITLNGGTLAVGGASNSGAQGNWTFNNAITLGTTGTNIIDNQLPTSGTTNRYLKLDSVISGDGGVTFRNTNAAGAMSSDENGFILAGTNTFTGNMVISAGAFVRIGGQAVGTTNASAGNSGSIASTVAITNDGVLRLTRNDAWTFANAMSGAGQLKIGGTVGTTSGQVVTLSGANIYTGATTVVNGRLNLTGSLTSNITVTGGAISGTGSTTGSLTLNTGATLALTGGATTTGLTTNGVTFAGATSLNFLTTPLAGNYDVVTYGAGGVTNFANLTSTGYRGSLSNDAVNNKIVFAATGAATRTWNTTSGTWAVATGTNFAEGDQQFYSGDSVIFNEPAAASTITLSGTLTPGSVTVNNTTNAYTFGGGTLAGGGGLTKTGAGVLTLDGTAFTGDGVVAINGGQLKINGSVALGTTTIAVGDNRSMVINFGSNTVGGAITLGSGSQLGIQNGDSGNPTINTAIILNAGSGAANAAQIGGFLFGNNTNLTGTISGTGDLRWVNGILGGGNNQATLTASNVTSGWAVNSYTGATSIEGNALTFGLSSNLNNATVTPFGNSANAVTIKDGSTVRFWQTGIASNRTNIANNITLNAATGQTTTIVRQDGDLHFTGNVAVSTTGTGKVVIISTWGANNVKAVSIDGVLSGSGALTIARAQAEDGVVYLTNNGNTYNGTITVDNTSNSSYGGGNAGRLGLSANGAAANASINLAVSGAHLHVNTVNATIASLTGVAGSQVSARSAGQKLTVNQAGDTTFAGVLGSGGLTVTNAGLGLVKSGAGTLTLTGTNLHTGGTTINAGTLVTGNTSALGAGATGVSVAAGATLKIGDGTVNTVTLGSGAALVLADGAKLAFASTAENAIALNGGTATLGSSTGVTLDLGGLFNAEGTYHLITGGTVTTNGATTFANFDSTNYSAAFSGGTLTVASAVPEPATYGLLGAGALAAMAFVKRRKKA